MIKWYTSFKGSSDREQSRHSRGLNVKWRRSILLGALLCGITLLINIAAAIFAIRSSMDADEDRKTLYRGDCNYTRRLNILIHLGINLLSTLLLASSNYAMQCLSAPTRTELDKAHAKRKWLDIGILSFRNLAQIKRQRLICWLLLGVSSVSLHFVFNSVFHESLSTHDYFVFQATESMVSNSSSSSNEGNRSAQNTRNLLVARMKAWEESGGPGLASSMFGPPSPGFIDMTNGTQSEIGMNKTYTDLWHSVVRDNLERLDNAACIRAYTSPFINRRKHLILVVSEAYQQKTDIPFLGLYAAEFKRTSNLGKCNKDGYDWVCQVAFGDDCHWGDGCSKQAQEINPRNWQTFQHRPTKYCLSEKIDQTCSLRFSTSLAWVVIQFNALKLLLLLACCLPKGPLGEEQPLLTAGDAISSYLRQNDLTTQHLSAMGAFDLTPWIDVTTSTGTKNPPLAKEKPLGEKSAQWRRFRLHRAVPLGRWVFLTLHFLVIISMLCACFGASADETVSIFQALSIPLGAVDVRTMLRPHNFIQEYLQSGFICAVLLANLPQLILSAVYLAFNRILTTFILSREVNDFSIRPKGLRVSFSPQGAQRSAYFLELPYRFALPFMLFSAILHWLCSQSFFFVSILKVPSISGNGRNNTLTNDSAEILTLGYSPQAIFILILLVMLMYATLVAFGMRRFKTKMPLSGSCSAVMSAMCHPPETEDGDEAVLKPLMWGVSACEIQDGVGVVECSFSSSEMRQPDDDDVVNVGTSRKTDSGLALNE